jgi:hypothetical protein
MATEHAPTQHVGRSQGVGGRGSSGVKESAALPIAAEPEWWARAARER